MLVNSLVSVEVSGIPRSEEATRRASGRSRAAGAGPGAAGGREARPAE